MDHLRISFPTAGQFWSSILGQDIVTVYTVNGMSVRSHDGTAGEMENTAGNCSTDKEPSSAKAVDEWQHSSSSDKEDDVLDD